MQRLYEVIVQTSEMFFWTENCWFSVKTLNYESSFLLVTPSSHLGWKGWVEIRAGGFRAVGGLATHYTQIWRLVYTCRFCLQTFCLYANAWCVCRFICLWCRNLFWFPNSWLLLLFEMGRDTRLRMATIVELFFSVTWHIMSFRLRGAIFGIQTIFVGMLCKTNALLCRCYADVFFEVE